MKITLRRDHNGNVSVYVAKKDLEQEIVSAERPGYWGGTVTLANGWTLALPDMPESTRLPLTVEARKLS